MPVESCNENGKNGVRWGKHGKCYTYTDEKSKKEAVRKMNKQRMAIEISKHASGKEARFIEVEEVSLADFEEALNIAGVELDADQLQQVSLKFILAKYK